VKQPPRRRRVRLLFLVEPFLDIVGALAGPELDDAEVGEAVRAERILLDDGLDLLPALATARMIPPSLGIFLPETRKCPAA
jgi:hypothetical protein